MHAGELFVCVVCKDDRPEAEASFDITLGGPVCEECRRNSIWAVAWMKREGIDRPFCKSDITNHNYKRFL